MSQISTGRPLDDLIVIDLTAARAGPQCVRQLSDWGADVICVEPPTPRAAELGDRHGSDFQNLHRNKRSVALDLKTEPGREALIRLLAHADVLVENMRPSAKHRLGIDYEAARAVNPRIVYGSISGFGQDGPGADRGGVDQIAQGAGGLMSVTGFPDGNPVRAGFAVTDLAAGLHCAIGILVGAARARTHRGGDLGQDLAARGGDRDAATSRPCAGRSTARNRGARATTIRRSRRWEPSRRPTAGSTWPAGAGGSGRPSPR